MPAWATRRASSQLSVTRAVGEETLEKSPEIAQGEGERAREPAPPSSRDYAGRKERTRGRLDVQTGLFKNPSELFGDRNQ